MLPQILQSRYLTKTYDALCARVAGAYPSVMGLEDAMREFRYLPAGNTLLAGADRVRPNCAILPAVHEKNIEQTLERARNLWRSRIGIGFDLGDAEDPLAILERLSRENDTIELGHRPKRGNMATLPVTHADAEAFCRFKVRGGRGENCYNFNISLTATEEDMAGEAWARVSDVFSEAAHACGDPGIVFIDRTRLNVPYMPGLGLHPIATTVPCGEQGMHPNEVCTLGSINLASPAFGGADDFDLQLFSETVRTGVQSLDAALERLDCAGDVLLEQGMRKTNRIGLGLMGLGDLFPAAEDYSSERALDFARRVGKIFNAVALDESARLAKISGAYCSLEGAKERKHAVITCIAPTGGISLLCGPVSAALEPRFPVAHSVAIEDRLRVIAAWQPFVHSAISSTLNLPSEATPKDIIAAVELAQRPEFSSIKSLAFYRDGSKSQQPVSCRSDTC